MKLVTREEFMKLPQGTIYSRVNENSENHFDGLYLKDSRPKDFINDWYEQDLISQVQVPTGPVDIEARDELIASGEEFTTDLHCVCRDGMFSDSDKFIIWSVQDCNQLIERITRYLPVLYSARKIKVEVRTTTAKEEYHFKDQLARIMSEEDEVFLDGTTFDGNSMVHHVFVPTKELKMELEGLGTPNVESNKQS